MLIETVVLALVIALLQGGRLGNLNRLSFKWMIFALLGFGLQLVIETKSNLLLHLPLNYQLIHDLSYLLLFVFLARNYSLPGLKFISLGVLLNFLVIVFNGGAMPVDPSMLPEAHRQLLAQGQGGTHSLLTAQTHLQFLADRIYVYLPLIKGQLFSIGDILIDIGSFYLIRETMGQPQYYRVKNV